VGRIMSAGVKAKEAGQQEVRGQEVRGQGFRDREAKDQEVRGRELRDQGVRGLIPEATVMQVSRTLMDSQHHLKSKVGTVSAES